jgi:hypothetical protein
VQNAGDESTVVQNKTGLMPLPFRQLSDLKVVCGTRRLA